MNSFDKLKNKLAELFQLDQADLDFGIYRIMNARRDEITRFLERDLLPQVREAFGEYKSSDKAEIQKELDKVAHGVKAAGMDPEQAPKVKELRARLAGEAVDVTALENEVYDHLCSFFSRYYDEGDFISLRRYKEGVYAIPYEGEEVKLHWANHDQYYIKTTEYFRDYAFKLKARYKGESDRRVHFKIVEADTEKDNIKAASGNDRRFLLHGDKPVVEENGELVIRFEYRPDGEKRRQDAINADTAERVIADLNNESLAAWKDRLAVLWKRAGGKESDKTILDKHLFDYTRRNTFDYFIHKDLEGFLRRELDFYIKNEVMRLDDIEEESAPRVEQYLSKIKVIRRIAHKIIDFLAQIENFQKKLWLKKKFVVETNYCVTLDRVPADLYPEIAANEAQREEWVKLGFVEEKLSADYADGRRLEEEKDLFGKNLRESAPSADNITVEVLKANDKLVLDTRFFGDDFKTRLVASIDDADGQCDGVLVHSENFQALNLMRERYRGRVKCIYIDPPYNTGSDEFVYRDSYQHSSWLTMIENRVCTTKVLLASEGLVFIHIDEREQARLALLIDRIFGDGSSLGPFIWLARAGKAVTERVLQIGHEYIVCARKSEANARLKLVEKMVSKCRYSDERGGYNREQLRQWGGQHDRREDRPTLYFPISTPFGADVYPKKRDGSDGCWRASRETVEKMLAAGDLDFVRDKNTGEVTVYRKIREGTITVSAASNIINDCGTSATATTEIKGLFFDKVFDTAKPIALAKRCISLLADGTNALTVDFFAGSGTTGHAVINLNREDNGNRKYILVEMGDYFNTVLKPRIQKVIYSENWKDGKPNPQMNADKKNNLRKSAQSADKFNGISHMFKYIRLESYEDALANIKLQRSKPQQMLIDKAGDFRESYMLKYMLDVESKGSRTLLNIDNFDDPWNYKLLVGAGSVGETKPVNADLVETFNWLLGLKVKTVQTFHPQITQKNADKNNLKINRRKSAKSADKYIVIEGENPNGEKILVIWRKVRDLDETDIDKIATAREQANRDLEAFFIKQQYNTLDSEFDVIYVNGDNNLMNVPLDPDKEGVEPRYKVRLIEEEFKRLMFVDN